MKKSLLALAVVAALPAVAQAQTNVTLYGIVDAALEFADNGPERAFRVSPGIQSGNRFGIRGTEDLGGGLKGVFNLEAGFGSDTGEFTANRSNAVGFGRRAVVGVQAGFGSVLLGRDYSPIFYALAGSDQLGYGFYNNVLSFDGTAIRLSNGLFFESASFGGLKVFAAYSAGNEAFGTTRDAAGNITTQSSSGRVAGIGARFQSGAFDIGAGYHDIRGTTGAANTIGADSKQYGIGGKVTFGVFNVNAGALVNDPDITDARLRQYWVGAGVKVGTGDLIGQYTRLDPEGTNTSANAFSIAYVYPFSRRTNLYVNYGTVRNNSAAAFGLVSAQASVTPGIPAGAPTAGGQDPQAIAIGVRHTF